MTTCNTQHMHDIQHTTRMAWKNYNKTSYKTSTYRKNAW